MRPWLRPTLLATVAGSLLATSSAWAQFDAGTGSSTTFTNDDFFIRVQDVQGHTLSDFDVARFFNKARCDCDQHVVIYVALSQAGLAKLPTASSKGSLEVWLGNSCNDVNLRGARCVPILQTQMSVFLHDDAARLFIDNQYTTARYLSGQPNLGTGVDGGFGGGIPNPDCTTTGEQFNQTIWVLVDEDMDGTPETSATQDVLIDLRAPPPPDSTTVGSGNQALILNWTKVDSALYPDLVGYQVLCRRGADLQVFADSAFSPGFQTCTNPDLGVGVVDPNFDGGIESLNPLFACSPLLSPTTNSYRVKILQNDITYAVAVVAIDNSHNASTPDIFYGAPIKTKSFYDVYRNDDPDHPGTANGGLCTLGIGPTSGGAMGGACAALAVGAILLARRGRKGRRR